MAARASCRLLWLGREERSAAGRCTGNGGRSPLWHCCFFGGRHHRACVRVCEVSVSRDGEGLTLAMLRAGGRFIGDHHASCLRLCFGYVCSHYVMSLLSTYTGCEVRRLCVNKGSWLMGDQSFAFAFRTPLLRVWCPPLSPFSKYTIIPHPKYSRPLPLCRDVHYCHICHRLLFLSGHLSSLPE